jgi:hypothetical protein
VRSAISQNDQLQGIRGGPVAFLPFSHAYWVLSEAHQREKAVWNDELVAVRKLLDDVRPELARRDAQLADAIEQRATLEQRVHTLEQDNTVIRQQVCMWPTVPRVHAHTDRRTTTTRRTQSTE